MPLICLISLILLILGIIEKRRHQVRIRRIPVRIHINGTRGKSLLTRLITDLLRESGWTIAAKTTGTIPEHYHHKVGWLPRPRRFPARIKEQMRFLREAAHRNVDAIVLENMALTPENQHIAEVAMMQSSLSVITNIRPDHQEVMGTSRDNIGATLAYSVPMGGLLCIPGREMTPAIQAAANQLKSRTLPVDASNEVSVFNPHFALLETISQHYGLPLSTLAHVKAEWQTRLSPENFIVPLAHPENSGHFVNLFSCNDVMSVKELVGWLERSKLIQPPYDFILTCRSDRPLRTMAFLEWILPLLDEGRLVLTGSFPDLPVERMRRKAGIAPHAIRKHRRIMPERIWSEFTARQRVILGIGNYVKTGQKILSHIMKDS
jgi:hypothetical protein